MIKKNIINPRLFAFSAFEGEGRGCVCRHYWLPDVGELLQDVTLVEDQLLGPLDRLDKVGLGQATREGRKGGPTPALRPPQRAPCSPRTEARTEEVGRSGRGSDGRAVEGGRGGKAFFIVESKCG